MGLIKNKGGLSPVIATVLLISLGIVLAGIIFLWMTGFVSEQLEKQGKPIEQICSEVAFEEDYDYSPAGKSINLQVTNRGNVPIYGFDIKFVGDGQSAMKIFQFLTPVGSSSDLQTILITVENVREAVLYPMVLGSVKGKKLTKPATCLGYGKTIRLE
jgi:FlaG/FlaF family flagellin (archaellin)